MIIFLLSQINHGFAATSTQKRFPNAAAMPANAKNFGTFLCAVLQIRLTVKRATSSAAAK